jgi:hypothetical protein
MQLLFDDVFLFSWIFSRLAILDLLNFIIERNSTKNTYQHTYHLLPFSTLIFLLDCFGPFALGFFAPVVRLMFSGSTTLY